MLRKSESAQSPEVKGGDKSLLFKLRTRGAGVTVYRLKDGHFQLYEIHLEKSGGGGGGSRGSEEDVVFSRSGITFGGKKHVPVSQSTISMETSDSVPHDHTNVLKLECIGHKPAYFTCATVEETKELFACLKNVLEASNESSSVKRLVDSPNPEWDRSMKDKFVNNIFTSLKEIAYISEQEEGMRGVEIENASSLFDEEGVRAEIPFLSSMTSDETEHMSYMVTQSQAPTPLIDLPLPVCSALASHHVQIQEDTARLAAMVISPVNALCNADPQFEEPKDTWEDGHRCFLTAIDLTYVLCNKNATGKTSLAKNVASSEEVRKVFNGGILWISAAGSGSHIAPLQLENMLTCAITQLTGSRRNIWQGLGCVDPVKAGVHHLTSLVQSRKGAVLCILDGVEDACLVEVFQSIRMVLLVTTRSEQVAKIARKDCTMRLDNLSHDNALAVLCTAAGVMVPPSPSAASSLIETFGVTAPAMAAIGKTLRHRTNWSSFATEAASLPNSSVHSTVLRALSEKSTRLFCCLAILPFNVVVQTSMLAEIWGLSSLEAEVEADTLEMRCLLVRISPGEYHLNVDALSVASQMIEDGSDILESARSRLKGHLIKLSTLRHHYQAGTLQVLILLWKVCDGEGEDALSFSCKAHISCKLYAQQLEQIYPCLDNVKSMKNDTLEILQALHQCISAAEHIFYVSSFATAHGCGCALIEMYNRSNEQLSTATVLVDKLSEFFNGGKHQQVTTKQLIQSARRALSCHFGLNLLALGRPEAALPKLKNYVKDTIGDGGKSRKSSLLDVCALQAYSRALLSCGLSETEALAAYESSFSLMRYLLGPSAALSITRCQDDLGDCLCKAGLLDAADNVLLASKKAKVAKLGARNPLVADTESLLGQVALRRGGEEGLSGAVSHFSECQQTRVAYFGPSHASVASVLLLLGTAQCRRGDWDAALGLFQEGKSILEDMFGKGSLHVAYAEVLMGEGVLGKLQAARTTAMSAAAEGPAYLSAHIDLMPRFAMSDLTTTEWWRKSMEEEEVDALETVMYIAEENVRRALENLEKGCASPKDQSQAAAVLSGLLLEMGRPEDAEPYARRRLENLKNHGLKWFGIRTDGIMSAMRLKSEALCNLIRVRRSLKQTTQLELLAWELLSCDQDVYEKTSEEVGQTKELLAVTLMENKKYHEAMAWMKGSLHIKIGLYEEGSLKLLPCMRFLAGVQLELGLLQEAEEQYREAHTIAETQLGSNHPESVSELHNIGMLTIKQNKFEDAEPIYVAIIAADTIRYGEASPQVVAEMHILAKVQYASGQLDQAEHTLKRALQLREASLGNQHEVVAETLMLLSALLSDKAKYAEAIPLLERSLCLLRAADDKKQIASCLEEIVSVHQNMGQYDIAIDRLNEALIMKKGLYGSESLNVGDTYFYLGELLEQSQKLDKAQVMYHRALKIREDKLGCKAEPVGDVCLKLSLLHTNLNHRVEAHNFASRAKMIKGRSASNSKLMGNENQSSHGGRSKSFRLSDCGDLGSVKQTQIFAPKSS